MASHFEQTGLTPSPDGGPPVLTYTTAQPTWQPAAVRTVGALETTYPLVLAPTKPLTLVQCDAAAV